ncbi:MAG TPA: nucleotidyltransferase family protein [Chitinophagaceae bacterium]|jgi:dTDP-glucose pyrophosphorylase|nr:nucleotidyltransferase family protein [Chitinophagaceae bacterium]
MKDWKAYVIDENASIRSALERIDRLAELKSVLFVVCAKGVLKGTVTDGDIRRGLIRNANLHDPVASVANPNFHKVVEGNLPFDYIRLCREKGILLLPNVSREGVMLGLLDLNQYKSSLPLHAVIMAGGKGERLMPLTRDTPKPMLHVGGKPIIEHNIDRLIRVGVRHMHISINYLGHVLSDYFGDGSEKGIRIEYIQEPAPLGTLGSISLVDHFSTEHILVMNSDLLTNIDFEDFYQAFHAGGADMAVATVPYHVDLPYAVLEIEDSQVLSLKEKPRYTYFANAGIYLLRRELLELVPKGDFFNATDLMELAIRRQRKVINYPIYGYWLDIGKPEDFAKAQADVKLLHL